MFTYLLITVFFNALSPEPDHYCVEYDGNLLKYTVNKVPECGIRLVFIEIHVHRVSRNQLFIFQCKSHANCQLVLRHAIYVNMLICFSFLDVLIDIRDFLKNISHLRSGDTCFRPFQN